MNTRSTAAAKQQAEQAGQRLSRRTKGFTKGFTLIESAVLLACLAVAASAVLPRCKNELLSGRPLGGSDGLVASHIGMQRFQHAAAGALEHILAPCLQGWRDIASMD
ncbi:type II secretion system protein [Variovorax atrisoli]|uniref:type II secretion system protein n=1 Tax=Variovorax atrisoli TaxID=3394203 RepID=UPI000F7F110A|nr:type II secretion system protein [Variovorax sp. 369]RTD87798.1 type II secretion system protein [Variovorax sp. 369]